MALFEAITVRELRSLPRRVEQRRDTIAIADAVASASASYGGELGRGFFGYFLCAHKESDRRRASGVVQSR